MIAAFPDKDRQTAQMMCSIISNMLEKSKETGNLCDLVGNNMVKDIIAAIYSVHKGSIKAHEVHHTIWNMVTLALAINPSVLLTDQSSIEQPYVELMEVYKSYPEYIDKIDENRRIRDHEANVMLEILSDMRSHVLSIGVSQFVVTLSSDRDTISFKPLQINGKTKPYDLKAPTKP